MGVNKDFPIPIRADGGSEIENETDRCRAVSKFDRCEIRQEPAEIDTARLAVQKSTG
jgi:hypothetical protein